MKRKIKYWINREHDRFAITGREGAFVVGRDMQGNPVKIPTDELQAWIESGIADITQDEGDDPRTIFEKILDRT